MLLLILWYKLFYFCLLYGIVFKLQYYLLDIISYNALLTVHYYLWYYKTYAITFLVVLLMPLLIYISCSLPDFITYLILFSIPICLSGVVPEQTGQMETPREERVRQTERVPYNSNRAQVHQSLEPWPLPTSHGSLVDPSNIQHGQRPNIATIPLSSPGLCDGQLSLQAVLRIPASITGAPLR